MVAPSRLNILLTHHQRRGSRVATVGQDEPQPWYQSVSRLLAPLGVRTFEATTGPQALDVIEQYPIHLAVVDTRLPGTDPLGVLRLIQRIRERTIAVDDMRPLNPPAPEPKRETIRMKVRIKGPQGETRQQIEVRFANESGASEPTGRVMPPTVILVTPARNDQLLPEAMKLSAFSVVQEPFDLNLMLDVMARAMRRFHQNLWPQ